MYGIREPVFRLLLASPQSRLTQIMKFTQETYYEDENLDIAG